MPVDLVLVRHGQSEGNAANKRSYGGDHSAFTKEFLARHSSQFRLTDLGRQQAVAAGRWIKDNLGSGSLDRCYVSEYIRAIETAALLGLNNESWRKESYLRERDDGQLDNISMEERFARFGNEMARRKRDGFFWAPPGGESMANLCLRVDRVLDTLHRECSDKRVIIVCHGEIMLAFRIRLERMSQGRYYELITSQDPFDRIHNCQIFHYTRRSRLRHTFLNPHYKIFRSICPTDLTLSRNEWEEIQRKMYTNEELLAEVNAIPCLVNDK